MSAISARGKTDIDPNETSVMTVRDRRSAFQLSGLAGEKFHWMDGEQRIGSRLARRSTVLIYADLLFHDP